MNNDNVSGKSKVVTSTKPGRSDASTKLAPLPLAPSNLASPTLLQPSSDTVVSPDNVINTLHVILNHTHQGLVVKE